MPEQRTSVRTARIGQTPFAVVDVETTGINARGHDRIVEIAVVRASPDGAIHDEFVTLVNPGRDVGPTDIHGITASDVIHAPSFRDVAGDIATRLAGAVVVGHQLRFDLSFLAAEFTRVGATLPRLPSLCTLHLAFKFLPETPSRKLAVCCEEAGVPSDDAHHALGDARATARLLAFYLDRARRAGSSDLAQLGCDCVEIPGPEWIAWAPSGRCLHRAEALAKLAQERGYLARLVGRLPGDDATDATQAEYLALLDRALEDRRIVAQEAEALVAAATSWGLSKADVKAAHRRKFTGEPVVVTRIEILGDGTAQPAVLVGWHEMNHYGHWVQARNEAGYEDLDSQAQEVWNRVQAKGKSEGWSARKTNLKALDAVNKFLRKANRKTEKIFNKKADEFDSEEQERLRKLEKLMGKSISIQGIHPGRIGRVVDGVLWD